MTVDRDNLIVQVEGWGEYSVPKGSSALDLTKRIKCPARSALCFQ